MACATGDALAPAMLSLFPLAKELENINNLDAKTLTQICVKTLGMETLVHGLLMLV